MVKLVVGVPWPIAQLLWKQEETSNRPLLFSDWSLNSNRNPNLLTEISQRALEIQPEACPEAISTNDLSFRFLPFRRALYR